MLMYIKTMNSVPKNSGPRKRKILKIFVVVVLIALVCAIFYVTVIGSILSDLFDKKFVF